MNREQKKIRFNFIDALIALLLLAVIGAATYLFITTRFHNKDSRQMGDVDITIRISAVAEETLPLFAEGVSVKDSVTGEVIGTIRAVQSEKTKYFGTFAMPNADGDGYIVPVSEYADKYDVYVTVSASAKRDTRGIYYVAGDTKVLVGSTVYLKIPSFTSISYITAFQPND